MAVSAKVDASVRRDFLVAAVMAAIGIALCAELWGYTRQARIFPLYLAGTMIFCGAGVAWSALRRSRNMAGLPPTESPDPAKEAADLAATRAGILRGALPVAIGLFAWTLAVSLGAGYLIPSIPMLMFTLWIAGERRPFMIAFAAPAIALVVFTLFYIIFRTRLPELDAIRDLVAPLRRLF